MSKSKEKELNKNNNPGFKVQDKIEIDQCIPSNEIDEFIPEKGEILAITLPEFGDFVFFKVTKWYFETGDLINKGNVICKIENKKITMEYESIVDGRITEVCLINKILKTGDELCKIERV